MEYVNEKSDTATEVFENTNFCHITADKLYLQTSIFHIALFTCIIAKQNKLNVKDPIERVQCKLILSHSVKYN